MKKFSLCKRIQKWLYAPINRGDSFGVHIRETAQSLFPCKHDWKEKNWRRTCTKCDKCQYLAYYRYGNLRTEWVDLPNILVKDLP